MDDETRTVILGNLDLAMTLIKKAVKEARTEADQSAVIGLLENAAGFFTAARDAAKG